ncbi:hypothetical protein [Pseudothermotoga thermarum]|uniref:hypothetical protein n=1 Tax=Pseudothermotoga thermarum TaxID=119394 RepID=UPI0002D9C90D|nr:hypothetical protein [Pseudothermotoga thermarum]
MILPLANYTLKTTQLTMLTLTDLYNIALSDLEKFLDTMYNYLKINPNALDEQIQNILENLWNKDEPINWYLINENGVIERTNYPPDLGLNLSLKIFYWEKLSTLKPGQKLFDPLTFEVKTGLPRFFSYVKLDDGRIFEIGIFVGKQNVERFLASLKELLSSVSTLTEILIFTENLAPISPEFRLTEEDRKNFQRLSNEGFFVVKNPDKTTAVYGLVKHKDCPFTFMVKMNFQLFRYTMRETHF